MADTKAAAIAYLEKHKVRQLLEEISTALCYHKPADPKAFIGEQLERLAKLQSQRKHSEFFTEQDYEGLFSLFDPAKTGSISRDQVLTAVTSIGLVEAVEVPDEPIDLPQFVGIMKAAVARERVF